VEYLRILEGRSPIISSDESRPSGQLHGIGTDSHEKPDLVDALGEASAEKVARGRETLRYGESAARGDVWGRT
jgi:hypothetical protein